MRPAQAAVPAIQATQAAQPPQTDQGLLSVDTDLFSVSVDPLDTDTYDAHMETCALGPLALAKIQTGGAIIFRRQEEISNSDFKRYSFLFVLEGEMILSYHRGVRELQKGQFLFIDNTYPRSMFVQNYISLLIISLPGLVLNRFFTDTRHLEGMILSSDATSDNTQSQPQQLIIDNWQRIQEGNLRDFAPMLTERLIRQLADIYSRHVHHSSNKRAVRISQAKELIEERLFDCELTIEALAKELEVSSRYLRSLFTPTEKISHYILRRRLEESARRLVAADNREQTITEIALNCGFVNVAHYCRTFRKHFNMTPGQYRKEYVQKCRT